MVIPEEPKSQTMDSHLKKQFDVEIQQGEAARQRGNEGMARVCARRAAGIAIGDYLTRRGYTNPGPSAYHRLQVFDSLPDVPPQVKEIAGHFLIPVTKDHTLPIEADLLAEARWLAEALLGE